MANGLQFSANGFASSNVIWKFGSIFNADGPPGVVEFYVQTQAIAQTFFSAQNTIALLGHSYSANLVLYSDAAGQLHLSTPDGDLLFAGGVNDGAWHQVSLYYDSQTYRLFIDGVAQSATSSARRAGTDAAVAPETGFDVAWSGLISFGSDQVSAQALAADFAGVMTELRIWQGGNTWTVLADPAFTLNLGVPVSSTAANLQAYWPLWANQATPLIDLCQKAALDLTGVVMVSGLAQIYGDMAEVICNGPMAPFNPLTTGGQPAAFAYIAQQIDMDISLAELRARYTVQSYSETFGDYYTDIKMVTYPGGEPSFSQQDFDAVQTQLLTELFAVSSCWGYYQAAFDNYIYLTQPMQQAATLVYQTAFAASMTSTVQADTDVGNVIGAVSSMVGVIPVVGAPMSAMINEIWAVANFSSGGDGNDFVYSNTLTIEADANTYEQQVTQAMDAASGNVLGSISLILTNGGLLQTVTERLENGLSFAFTQNLNPTQSTEAAAALKIVFNAAQLTFSQLLLCAGYALFKVGAETAYDGQINDPLFQYTPTDFGTNIIGFQNGTTMYNGAEIPVLATPFPPVAQLLSDAAAVLSPQQNIGLEMFEFWPFPVVVPADQADRRVEPSRSL